MSFQDENIFRRVLNNNQEFDEKASLKIQENYCQENKNLFTQRSTQNKQSTPSLKIPQQKQQNHYNLQQFTQIREKQLKDKQSIIREQIRLDRIKQNQIDQQNKDQNNSNNNYMNQLRSNCYKNQNFTKQNLQTQQNENKKRLIENLKQQKQNHELNNQKARQDKIVKEQEIQQQIQDEQKRKEEYQKRMKKMLNQTNLSEQLTIKNKPFANLEIKKPVNYNSDGLLKFLLQQNFFKNLKSLHQDIPNNFQNFQDYRKIFQPLYQNECFYQIQSKVKSLNMQHQIFYGQLCLLNSTDNETQDDFTYFELKEKKNSKFDSNLIDLITSKNYLVFLTSQQEFDPSLQNDVKFQKDDFLILGQLFQFRFVFCNNGNKFNPKIKAFIDNHRFQKFFRSSDWIDVFIHPIEKITTQMREFQSIINLENFDLSNHIINKDQIYENHDIQMEKFFGYLKNKCNKSQYKAILNICSSQQAYFKDLNGKNFHLASDCFRNLQLDKIIVNSQEINIGYDFKQICAPSNAAVDEIILRILKYGLIDVDGKRQSPKLVRVGILDHTNDPEIHQISLEEQANQKFSSQPQSDIQDVKQSILRITEKINKNKNQEDVQILYDKRRVLIDQYQKWKIQKNNEKEKYQQILTQILQDSDIICTTLGSSGSEKLELIKNHVNTLIIDESTQSCEPQNLIPLKYNMKKMILIGDPQQLPATTFSPDAEKTLYNRSLFERLTNNGMIPNFLEIQYRMHQNIRAFPSLKFYENRLQDSEQVINRKFPQYLRSFQKFNHLFIDLPNSQESVTNNSYYNLNEIDAIKSILQNFSNTQNLGIISPYKSQVKWLRNHISDIEINSIDSFQGQEKEVIIFSTVRSNSNFKNQIGFLKDYRRINVALTRAKFVLIVIGNANTLYNDPLWRSYLQFCNNNNSVVTAKSQQEVSIIFDTIDQDLSIPKFYNKLIIQGQKINKNQDQDDQESIQPQRNKYFYSDQKDEYPKIKIIKQNPSDDNQQQSGLSQLISNKNVKKDNNIQNNFLFNLINQ